MEETVKEIAYALDTLYFLLHGTIMFVLLAGLVMLEHGLAAVKSSKEIVHRNIGVVAAAIIAYYGLGYGLMYSGETSNSYWPGLHGILTSSDNTAKDVVASNGDIYYSNLSDFFFQLPFAVMPVLLVSIVLSDRVRTIQLVVFSVLFSGLIWPLFGYWEWGGGFLNEMGFSDFAGATVICTSAGWAALTGAIVLGPRPGTYRLDGGLRPQSLASPAFIAVGCMLVWLGWAGMTAGSELKVSDVAEANAVAKVYVNTWLAGAGGWAGAVLLASWLKRGGEKTIVTGLFAGLVSITGDPLSPFPLVALLVGSVGGVIAIGAGLLLDRLHIDDAVGGIAPFLGAGLWGTFVVSLVDPDVTLQAQVVGIVVNALLVVPTSTVLWLVLSRIFGMRSE